MIDSSYEPFLSFSYKQEIPGIIFLFNNWNLHQIALHHNDSRPIWCPYEFPRVTCFPKELLTIISKYFSDVFSPQRTLLFKVKLSITDVFISFVLQLVDVNFVNLIADDILLDFLHNLGVIYLHEHPLTHSNI